MAKPNVIINPLSMVAPGMLREIFQMVPQNPSVTPAEGGSIPIVRESAYARPPAAGAPRAEPRPRQKRPAAPTPQVLDGWSSETTVPRQR
jgi:hypothetical protein